MTTDGRIEDHGQVTATVPPQQPTEAPAAASTVTGLAPGRKLYRAASGRILGGVCRGLARHLGVPVALVRVAFVLLAFSGGAGVVAYVAFWALVPLAPETEVEPARDDPAEGDDPSGRLGPLLALAAVGAGALLLAQQLGVGTGGPVAIPILVVGVGIAVLWRVADDAQRARWRRTATASATGRRAWVRVVVGVTLVVVGAVAVLGTRRGFQAAVDGLAGALVVVAGVALVAGPWLYRNARDLAEERRERIRSQERAELAAHVHDSVVQTLTLIQRNADDPRAVTRLARAEERALRQWLYRPAPDAGSFRTRLEAAAAEVEDVHGGAVEVVVVGDAHLDERLAALLHAAREAILNAVKYAGAAGAVQVYAEVEDDRASVFVRDRGPGFDLDAVPEDRLGLRQSVFGRMARVGGTAEVRSTPGEGTEVRLAVPLVGSARRNVEEER
jgi:signal transduction histidine kinase/phage shock protein PspC (stress-responsive transcriptional regulator)